MISNVNRVTRSDGPRRIISQLCSSAQLYRAFRRFWSPLFWFSGQQLPPHLQQAAVSRTKALLTHSGPPALHQHTDTVSDRLEKIVERLASKSHIFSFSILCLWRTKLKRNSYWTSQICEVARNTTLNTFWMDANLLQIFANVLILGRQYVTVVFSECTAASKWAKH